MRRPPTLKGLSCAQADDDKAKASEHLIILSSETTHRQTDRLQSCH